MHFDLEQRRAWLSAGELADFLIGPREGGAGSSGLWRAQLGTQWHRELRERAAGAEFEVAVEGEIVHRGWTLVLSGRIDQLLRSREGAVVREIKTITQALPASEASLRADYPAYFVQLAAYAEVMKSATDPTLPVRSELVFVEVSTGLVQTVELVSADASLFCAQLDRVAEFLELRLRGTERLRRLRFRPPFESFRAGQAEAIAELQAAFGQRGATQLKLRPKVLLDAPTGFGKTGVLLEFALGQLCTGRFERVVYLTSKATGQLQVVRTLAAMTASAGHTGASVAVWQVRAKAEHCVNSIFHCVRERCGYLADLAERWPQSGLARFYLFENEPRDLETLRDAGRAAVVCPYEITRAALAFNDVWIGDYNYVFAPANRSLFYLQPGFDPSRTLLIVDEAHNLPTRAADAHSFAFDAADAEAVRLALHRIRAPAGFMIAWEEWAHFLGGLAAAAKLGPGDEAEARRLIDRLAEETAILPLDRAALGPQISEAIGRLPALASELESIDLPRLWWCPHPAVLRLTCLDAAAAVGAALGEFGGAVLATATPGPREEFAEACGLADDDPAPAETPAERPEKFGELGKRETKRLFNRLTSGAGLLQAGEARFAALAQVRADAPWRAGAYDLACDLRVDTTFQHRERHYGLTAAAAEALRRSSGGSAIAVFFSSYAYAENILRALAAAGSDLRAALQPRLPDLAAQAAWVEGSLASADALFLVLGSSFAESIDLLGGRVTRAMVVGPALPEVNPVQRARLAVHARAGRDAAFRRVYQIPGMQKVNQALGRLVRAPGQQAKVLLHCRRFAEPGYAGLLAPEYRSSILVRTDEEFASWLDGARID